MKSKCFLICFATLLIFATSAPALMRGYSIEELVEGADLIVIGVVEGVESFWTADGKAIYTRAKVKVEDLIRAKESLADWAQQNTSVYVQYPGGEIGEIGLRVSDLSPLKGGERALLFLKESVTKNAPLSEGNGNKIYTIKGRGQGKYTISSQGIALRDSFTTTDKKIHEHNEMPLEVLLQRIRGTK